MNLGSHIVAVVLDTADLRPFLDAGLTRAWLVSPDSDTVFDSEGHTAYLWLLDHWHKHRKVPESALFRRSFPPESYRLPRTALTPAELIEQATSEVQRLVIGDMIRDTAELHDEGKVTDAVDRVMEATRKLAQGVTGGHRKLVNFADDFDFEEFQNKDPQMGVPMGIPAIDDEFWGWQPGMLITLLGRQKALKTTLMVNNVAAAYDAGYSSLYYSPEMSDDLLRQRLYAIGAGINPEHIRRGTLSRREKAKIQDYHARIVGDKDDVEVWVSDLHAMFTIDDIEAQIDDASPNVVFVDGMYFMKDRITGDACTDWKAADNVSRELKNLARDTETPIVVSTQVREKQHNQKSRTIEGGTMRDGTGLLQDSDLVMGLNKDKDTGYVFINGVVNRFGHFDTVQIEWDWDTMTFESIDWEDPTI